MHWRKAHETDSKNLSSADLFDEKASEKTGRPTYLAPIVKIEKMSVARVKSREKPKGEARNFAHFVGKRKPFGLNVTNCETLTSLAGSPDTARWVGLTIALYVDLNARYPNGKTGPAIRIRPNAPSGPADTTPLPELAPETRERLEDEHADRLANGPDEGP